MLKARPHLLLSLSQTGEQSSYTSVRERKREGKREKIKRGKEGGRERERKREKERERERCPELLLFLKGMTGALAPFSYLVSDKTSTGSPPHNL